MASTGKNSRVTRCPQPSPTKEPSPRAVPASPSTAIATSTSSQAKVPRESFIRPISAAPGRSRTRPSQKTIRPGERSRSLAWEASLLLSVGTTTMTLDQGATWNLAAGPPGGFRSAVAFLDRNTLLTVGTGGEDVSTDQGAHWTRTGDLDLNAIAVLDGAAWAVGPDATIARWSDHSR